MRREYDIAVIGSGFAGSLFAMIARRLGRSVILLEKGKHPRFAIGESSTPLSNLLLEELALRYDLPGIAPLAKWGTWLKSFPDLDCGLKRGFTFYHHRFGERAATDPDHNDQLLVAASPRDEIADTHWNRARVDAHFVREAQAIGVEYRDEVSLTAAAERNESVELSGLRGGSDFSVSARFVVDATGPRGFLHRAFALPELSLPDFPQTQGLYTHFRGVRRLQHILHPREDELPYPLDDAAVHHVFEGGWIWVLRFRSGITSAGVAAQDSSAATLRLSEGASAWERLIEALPVVRDQFADAIAIRPFVYAPRLAFRSGVVAGRRWALLPSAAGFVDPLLSTGFPLVLLGVSRLAEAMEREWATDRFGETLASYAKRTDDDLLATAKLIGSLYDAMGNFPLFVSLSHLYFAAASYAETVRRLGKPHLAAEFLLRSHPALVTQLPEIYERARAAHGEPEMKNLNEDILRAIEPINVVGLGDPLRRNWYPVDASGLLNSAAKLEASRSDVIDVLSRCGFLLAV